MNIEVGTLAAGAVKVEELLDNAGRMLARAIEAASELNGSGVAAARSAGVSPGLIGEVLDFAGRMQADLGHAALMLQGVHASLHEAYERLAPSEEKAGGGGGKEPPPKP